MPTCVPKVYFVIRGKETSTVRHNNIVCEYRYLGTDLASGGYPYWSHWISGGVFHNKIEKAYESYLSIKKNPCGNVEDVQIIRFDESTMDVCDIEQVKMETLDSVTKNALAKLNDIERVALLKHFRG